MAAFKGINSSAISSLAGWEEWNGSSWIAATRVPTVGDTAYANGFNKQINQNWSVDEIRNNTFQSTTATGRFEITTAGITFIGSRISQTVPVLFISYGGGTSTVNGLMTRNAGSTNTLIQGQSGGVLNLEYATNSLGDYSQGVLCENNSNGFIINSLNIYGPVGGGNGGYQYGMRVTGNGYIINNNGIVQGGTAPVASGLILAGSNNTFNNYGIVYGGSWANTLGVYDQLGNLVYNYGIIQASELAPAIAAVGSITSATAALARLGTYIEGGVRLDSNQFNAVIHNNIKIAPAPAEVRIGFKQLDNSSRSTYTAGLLTGYPAEADVEDGVIYGPSNEFEGTMEPWDATFAQALATAQRDLQLPSILSAITAP